MERPYIFMTETARIAMINLANVRLAIREMTVTSVHKDFMFHLRSMVKIPVMVTYFVF